MAAMDENKRLLVENEKLRSFNVRRERRLKWMMKPKSIDADSVSQATHILGTPPSIIAALLYCENGPENLETGSIDKTDYFALNFPIARWSTLDGTRTLNRMLWEWFLAQDEPTQKSFYMSAAKPYTALSKAEQKSWAANMRAAELRFRKQITQEVDKPLVSKLRTPTP
jgi:hypothetical protein